MLIDKILDYDVTSALPIILWVIFLVFFAFMFFVSLWVFFGIFYCLYWSFKEPKRKDKFWAFGGFLFCISITLMSVKPAWEMWKKLFGS